MSSPVMPKLTICITPPPSQRKSKSTSKVEEKSIELTRISYLTKSDQVKDWKAVFKKNLLHANIRDAKACYNVAFCYRFGKGIHKNQEEAIKWYQKAASYGDNRSYLIIRDYEIAKDTLSKNSIEAPPLIPPKKRDCCCTIQ